VLTGCTTPGVTVTAATKSHTISESGARPRGHNPAYVAPVTIEGAQQLNQTAFQDLRAHFLLPLQLGPYRYALEAITLQAQSENVAEWTLLLALDTGARIKIEDFGVWDEKTQSNFTLGYRRTLSALNRAREEDPSLDRYVRFWSGKRKTKTVALAPGTGVVEAPPPWTAPVEE
jgi:hypothetical protein